MKKRVVIATTMAVVMMLIAALATTSIPASAASKPQTPVTVTGAATWYTLRSADIAAELATQGVTQNVEFRIVPQVEVDQTCGRAEVNYCVRFAANAVVYLSSNPKLDRRYAQPLSHTVAHVIADFALYYLGRVTFTGDVERIVNPPLGDDIFIHTTGVNDTWGEKLSGWLIHERWPMYGEWCDSAGGLWH